MSFKKQNIVYLVVILLCFGEILTQSAGMQCSQVCDVENCVDRNCDFFNCTKTETKINYCIQCRITGGVSSICKSFSSNSSNQVQYSALFLFFLISINFIVI